MKNIFIQIGKYFPIGIGIISFLNLIMLISNGFNGLSALVSVIGIATCALSFKREYDKYNKYLLYIWIGSQAVVLRNPNEYEIKRDIFGVERYHFTNPVFDCSQVLTINAFRASKDEKGQRGYLDFMVVNVLVIAYVALYRLYVLSRLIGSRITLYKLRRAETVLDDFMPAEATIIKQMQLGKDQEWLLVQTDKYLYMDDMVINNFLIQRKDKELLKPGSGNQVLYFRAVINEGDILVPKHIDTYPQLDWVVCT